MFFLPPDSIKAILFDVVQLIILMIILDIIISWARLFGARVSSHHPFVRFVSSVVNPILDPVRRLIPPYKTGNWDLSGIIVILLLQGLMRLIWTM